MSHYEVVVVHNPERHRFEAALDDGSVAVLDYQIAGKNMLFTYTGVPPQYEGRGIASQLVKVGLDYARDNGYKIQALCSFVDVYVRRHPEYQPITWGYE
jgi:hypothetical protein